MAYYRVDKRVFSLGEEVTSAQEYYEKFTDSAKVVEDTLELTRPQTKKQRTECLFIFESEVSARKHWSKMTDGKLYRVEIEEANVCHRGDMAMLDTMKRLAEAGDCMTAVADSYWRGELGAVPEVEIMLSRAVVNEVLSTSEVERLDHLRKRWGISKFNPYAAGG